jgi:CheY-like chemotaxis protein
MTLQVLHLEDNPADAELLRHLLNSEGIACSSRRVETRTDFEAALEHAGFDLIISDFTLPSFDGLSALKMARRKCPAVPFIFVSGTIGEKAAIDSLKEGAIDYVLKDNWSRLPAVVRRAMGKAQERAERSPVLSRLGPADLRKLLDGWPYDPGRNIRLERSESGREFMLVRQPMGLEQYEVEGRPDGQHPHGMGSVFEFQVNRVTAAGKDAFRLTAADCAELFDEATMYYQRFVYFFRLRDWLRAERDTARNLRLIDFVKLHAEHEEDRAQLEQWRPTIASMNAVARALIMLNNGQYDGALKIALDNIGRVEDISEHQNSPSAVANVLLQKFNESLATCPNLRRDKNSVFIRHGDYWTVTYQGRTAYFKAVRGLSYLSLLLRHPGREFHVCDIVAERTEISELVVPAPEKYGSGPILDAQAKAEYRRRLVELQEELDEAQRFDDQGRVAEAQDEINAIATQLASAVGLGGRDRRTGSGAERARSAVTKRIKESINRIGKVLPTLGRHFDTRVKTGYFCSYNPHPDHPVFWKF